MARSIHLLIRLSIGVSMALQAISTATATIVSTADSKLPMSLSMVVSDLEAEGCTEISTACWITSQSVSKQTKIQLLEEILASGDIRSNEEAGKPETWKAVAVAQGLALAQPDGIVETAHTACACGGQIVFYADPVDLQRAEGIFDKLAPAMERILSSRKVKDNRDETKTSLFVIVSKEQDIEQVKHQLNQIANSVLTNMIANVRALEDVFDRVVYVRTQDVLSQILESQKSTPEEIAARVAQLWPDALWSSDSASTLSPANLAAARNLGPLARRVLADLTKSVETACEQGLVPNFGELCDAAFQRADVDTSSSSGASSSVGQRIRQNLKSDLDAALSDLFVEQLQILQLSHFEEFKRDLSKLLVSPTLRNDMETKARQSIAAFGKAAQKLVPKKKVTSDLWKIIPTKSAYARQLHEYVQNRIQAAQASGKFRPLPRKGVTVGLHWLLPKPFGNDFRQEPWMVHATDNMVYIPRDKITDVNPEDVATGDWRDKIVPSPAGNDILYMQ
jgi:hypothetical protein